AGMTPDKFYGADGIFDPTLPGAVDPDEKAIIDGTSAIGAAGTAEFLERIAPITENNLIYSGQAYDCTVLMALAVETVGNLEDGAAIVEAAIQATKDGKKCSTFEECKGLIADGEDIDYDGAGGALELDETGDPTEVTYSIATFQDEGTLTAVDSKDVDVTELAG
ncbi:MAG: amino acid ABC transporter substrate-binding protein, partial [Actinobacteria bacterium]|nr:amino acid ABC transporter substrate-binding protein [Actinomycetota bacterium]